MMTMDQTYKLLREQREQAFNAWKETRYTDKQALARYQNRRDECARAAALLAANGGHVSIEERN